MFWMIFFFPKVKTINVLKIKVSILNTVQISTKEVKKNLLIKIVVSLNVTYYHLYFVHKNVYFLLMHTVFIVNIPMNKYSKAWRMGQHMQHKMKENIFLKFLFARYFPQKLANSLDGFQKWNKQKLQKWNLACQAQ